MIGRRALISLIISAKSSAPMRQVDRIPPRAKSVFWIYLVSGTVVAQDRICAQQFAGKNHAERVSHCDILRPWYRKTISALAAQHQTSVCCCTYGTGSTTHRNESGYVVGYPSLVMHSKITAQTE